MVIWVVDTKWHNIYGLKEDGNASCNEHHFPFFHLPFGRYSNGPRIQGCVGVDLSLTSWVVEAPGQMYWSQDIWRAGPKRQNPLGWPAQIQIYPCPPSRASPQKTLQRWASHQRKPPTLVRMDWDHTLRHTSLRQICIMSSYLSSQNSSLTSQNLHMTFPSQMDRSVLRVCCAIHSSRPLVAMAMVKSLQYFSTTVWARMNTISTPYLFVQKCYTWWLNDNI